MPDENRNTLSKYRLLSSKETLEEAEALLIIGKYKGANNRAYYAIFHSLRAVLALDGLDSRKHSGVISMFNEHYIKTKIFTSNYGKIVANASAIRNNSDYDDFYIATIEQAQKQVEEAKLFYNAVEKFILALNT